VPAPLRQGFQLWLVEQLRQVQPDGREGCTVGPHDRRDQPRRRRRKEAEPQLPHLAATDAPGLVEHPLDLGKGEWSLLEQRAARVGQPDAALGSDEEPQAEHRLEVGDRPAQRRLREVQSLRGAPKVQLVGDREEVAKQPQVGEDGPSTAHSRSNFAADQHAADAFFWATWQLKPIPDRLKDPR
jgi:hypothetical protein